MTTTTKIIPQAPFKVGDRVRRKKPYRSDIRRTTGIIVGDIDWHTGYTIWNGVDIPDHWSFRIRLDHKKELSYGSSTKWELETDPEILRDHNANLLIKAYQEGDKTALRPLIDRLLELL